MEYIVQFRVFKGDGGFYYEITSPSSADLARTLPKPVPTEFEATQIGLARLQIMLDNARRRAARRR